MKYEAGNIVSLYNGKNVYILSVDKQAKKYLVTDTDDSKGNMFQVDESEIYMLLT